jgi:hypothetical protein
MVLQATDILVDLRVRDALSWHGTRRVRALRSVVWLLALTSLIAAPQIGTAQEQNSDFVDAFAPVDASAAAFHNEKFQEAERALFEGLSRRDESPTAPLKRQAARSEAPNRGEQTAKRDRTEDAHPAPLVHRAPVVKDSSERAGIDSAVAVMPVALNQNQRAEVSEPSHKPAPKVEAASSVAAVSKAQASPAKTSNPIQPTKPAAINGQNRTVANDTEVQQLRRELADAKSQLAAAEMEISRLSTIIQDASRARLSIKDSSASIGNVATTSLPRPSSPKQVVQPSSVSALNSARAEPADPVSDLQVATITVEKADLRLGPGRNHSALMSLRRGSRLAVEARQGEWYRVFAPNGQRAWIHSSLVRFGDGAASLNDGSSVKVRGYDSKLQ